VATVSERVVDALSVQVTELFGVMGNGNAHVLDAAARTAMRFTAVRHEAGAVVAADAYFRAGGHLAVATTTYGPGFTNLVTPLAEVVQAGSSVVVVVGDAPTTGRRPWDVDQVAIAAAVGAETFTVTADAPFAITTRAVAHALEQRTAVVLAIPYDLAAAEAGDADDTGSAASTAVTATAPSADPAGVEQVVRRLAAARRPVILAGRGAWLSGAGSTLAELADELGALVATTAQGVNVVPDHPFSLGIAGGFAHDRAAELIHQADVVLVVGARLNQFTMRFGDSFGAEADVVQIDVADAATHPRVDLYLRADAATASADILRGLRRARAEGAVPGTWRAELPDLPGFNPRERDPGTGLAADGRLDPRSVAVALDRLLPANRLVVEDGGHFLGWAPTYLELPAPDHFLMTGTAFQVIGLGLPAAVGAARARPDATVVLCAGDGGTLMALADLDTVARTVEHGVVVVFNDAAYGAEIHQYGRKGLDTAPMLIDEVDFAAYANAAGMTGVRVESLDDLDVLRQWQEDGSPGVLLLDCRVSQAVVAPYMEEIIAATARARAQRS
jgi:thiamine pyrophosphate-dependent acetolactate synthase large subunit-like protein